MRITVIGAGYVGLVTAAGLAETGHAVRAIDVDASRVAGLSAGVMPFYEPGLAAVVDRAVRGRRLAFASSIGEEDSSSDIFFLAVGTPFDTAGRVADLSGVWDATDALAPVARRGALVAVKSTVPVGTCDAIEARLRERGRGDVLVASNPEFLKQGTAIDDFFRPDRVVIGVDGAHAEMALRNLYRPLQISTERIFVTDRRTAELAKYAANAMLATRISFMNELARLCDRVGADVSDVRRALGSDRRIGPSYLHAGPGYGGSCLPKDSRAMLAFAAHAGVRLGVVAAAIEANEAQHEYVVTRVLTLFPEGLAGRTIAVWGLSFKPETDDVRESSAAPVIEALVARGASVRVHDPEANATFARAFGLAVETFDDEYDAADGADALLLMTEWRKFRNPDFEALARRLRRPAIVDARNVWAMHGLRARGFAYVGIGTRAGRE